MNKYLFHCVLVTLIHHPSLWIVWSPTMFQWLMDRILHLHAISWHYHLQVWLAAAHSASEGSPKIVVMGGTQSKLSVPLSPPPNMTSSPFGMEAWSHCAGFGFKQSFSCVREREKGVSIERDKICCQQYRKRKIHYFILKYFYISLTHGHVMKLWIFCFL